PPRRRDGGTRCRGARSFPIPPGPSVADIATEIHHDVVPEILRGCWRRAWIEFGDGRRDDTGVVMWLQTERSMVDVRIPADRGGRAEFDGCISIADCTIEQLRAIATSDGSCGYTECSSVVDSGGRRSATAEWHTRGQGVCFQPISAFPEPGRMTWNDDGTVMHERAPSGAYIEEWRLVPGSRDPLTAGKDCYRAGNIAVLVRDRTVPIPRQARLADLLDEFADDRAIVDGLLDCEFTIAERLDGHWTVTASTLPWLEGTKADVDLH
ncbi:MAG TPA: hypothetical protein VFE86_06770, partial [Ilumatobacteraceae bacterium]|nr:hypothetical protein [Ilumatobacteraceae bacterium]